MDLENQGMDEFEAAEAFGELLGDDLLAPGDETVDGKVVGEEEEEEVEKETPEGESEDEPEEESEEDPEGESEDEPEADAEDDLSEKLFEIPIGDDIYEVNFEELKSGYLRNEEFVTRQAELEEEYAAKLESVDAERANLLAELEQYTVTAIAGANQYDSINWEQLKAQDPEKYQKLRLEALEARDQAQALIKRRNDIKAMQEKRAEIIHSSYIKRQTELAKKLIPEMTTDETWGDKIVAYGKSIGYSEDEIRGIADARQLAVLDAARKWAESQVRRKAALEKKEETELPAAVKPVARRAEASEGSKRVKAARANLRKDQSVEAAAALFSSLDIF
ncbi:scaffolding protein [Klebsiella pneumoniae]|uniref:scaffolding protein n=1 Tax=Klebsiella pneumoniae TaxID=573 RepID=UPI001378733C|nr:scaffolding protein [Klebsiella pneumoniae]WOR80506.1 head scaffolding protein [Pseudomonas phage PSP30]